MTTHQSHLVYPPAPPVHENDLSQIKLVLGSITNSLAIWPDYAFDTDFSRNRLFGIETVLVNSPEGIHHVMMTNRENYVRPPMMARIIGSLIGKGLFLAEGDDWKQQKRMLAPSFTPAKVNLLLPHFSAAAVDMLESLRGCKSANLSDVFQKVTLNAVFRALFSVPGKAERGRLEHYVRKYVTGPGRPQIFDGFAKSENAFAFTLGRRRAFQKKWFAALEHVIEARKLSGNPDQANDILDLLLAANDPETGRSLANTEIRDQCATMIFAGYETTARLLFWAIYLLTLAPTQQDIIRSEVRDFPLQRVKSLTDLENWPRLRSVLLEALRLYPPVPLLVRQSLQDDVISGETVMAGTQTYIAPWLMHRHRKYWEHPTAFVPGRFEETTSPWTTMDAYLPFGAGPRICIGAAFAMAEAQIIMANLLENYHVSLDSRRAVLPVGRLTTLPNHMPMFALREQ